MKQILQIAKKYTSLVKKTGIPVTAAYLYGSYAKGTAHKDSDIDICIISTSFGKNYFDEMLRLTKMRKHVDNRIEPVPLTPEDFNDRYSSLAKEIKTTGVKLP